MQIEGKVLKVIYEIRRIPVMEVLTDQGLLGVRAKNWADLPRDLLGARIIAFGRQIERNLFLADVVGVREPSAQTVMAMIPSVIVDSNEATMASLITAQLKEFGCEVLIKSLAGQGADYVLSHRIAVQRKSLDDLCASISDGRVFDEMADLAAYYQIPVLLIEGLEAKSKMRPESVAGVLAYLTTELAEIRIIHTKNAMDTALLLSRLAKREQLDRKASLPVLKEAYKAKDLSEAQLRVVASLPGIGARTGLKLLKDLETPEAVMTADEMKFAEYVGRKRARKIKEVLTEPFERAERIF